MNKKIVAISILMLMMCAMAASVFADEAKWEYKYNVTVSYDTGRTDQFRNPIIATKTYPVWASSQSEAMDIAERMCKWEVGAGKVTSCGIPVPTGERRER